MEKSLFPKFWDEISQIKSGLPFVAHSVERILDSNYHKNEASRHKYYELIYVQKGEATFDIAGAKVPVSKKDFLIINPMEPHRLMIDEEKQCSLISLKFNFKSENKLGNSAVLLEDFLYYVSKEQYGTFIKLNSCYRNEIVYSLNKITVEIKNNSEDSEFLCSLIVMELFVWLSRALKAEWENSVNKHFDKLKEMMETARNFIEENYANDIGLNDIANYIYLSPSHFARVFKKFYAISPIQYLLSVRISEAKFLLEKTGYKICDIALNVGFSAQQRFNEIFKKQVKMSPSEYRAMCKQKNINK